MDDLKVYCLYDKTTSDFPGEYVVRAYSIDHYPKPEPELFYRSKDLAEIRVHMERKLGLVFIPREEKDDPVIIGSYI